MRAVARLAAGIAVTLADATALRIAGRLVAGAGTAGRRGRLGVGFRLRIARLGLGAALVLRSILVLGGALGAAPGLGTRGDVGRGGDRDGGCAREAAFDLGSRVVGDDVQRHRGAHGHAVASRFGGGHGDHRVGERGGSSEFTAQRDRAARTRAHMGQRGVLDHRDGDRCADGSLRARSAVLRRRAGVVSRIGGDNEVPGAAGYGLAVLDLGHGAVERDVQANGGAYADVGARRATLCGRGQYDILGAVLGTQVHIATGERDDRDRGVRRPVTDDGAGVRPSDVDGHGAGHASLAATGSRHRFRVEAFGLVDQLLELVAVAGQMDELARGRVFARRGQADFVPAHDDHVKAAQITEAGHGGAAAVRVCDGVAGVQVGGVAHFQEARVAGGVEADVGRKCA